MADQNSVIHAVLVVTGVTDINPDPGCCGTTDPDMTLGSNPGLDNTMAPSDSTGHSGQHDPSGGTTLGHPQVYRLQPTPWASVWSSVGTWARDINTDPVVEPRTQTLSQTAASTQLSP